MQGLCKQTHKSACEVYSLLYHSAAIQEVFPILMLAWKRTVYFEEGIFNAERANSMIGQIIPDTFFLATITKEEVDWEANIFVFRTGHQRTFVRYGKRIYSLTNIFVFRPVRYQSILQDDWRIYSSLLVTHTMIENIFFEAYRIRKKLWYRCPWCKSPAVLGEDSWKYFRSERVKVPVPAHRISVFWLALYSAGVRNNRSPRLLFLKFFQLPSPQFYSLLLIL